METINNYNAISRFFLDHAYSLVIGVVAIVAQVFVPCMPKQGFDFVESFFTHALFAQFTHLSWYHLGLNLAGLLLITWGFTLYRSHREWFLIQTISLIWVAFYLTFIEPLNWYCGLSGALHFQFTACLLLAFERTPKVFFRNWTLWVMAIALLFKLLIELSSSHSVDLMVGGPIAHQAHRGGALGALLMGLGIWVTGRWNQSD